MENTLQALRDQVSALQERADEAEGNLAEANTHIDTLRQVNADYVVELDALKLQRVLLTKALRMAGDLVNKDGSRHEVAGVINAALCDEVVA